MIKIHWKQVGIQSIVFFIIILSTFLITFVFVSVELAIYHSILVEIALKDVFTSLASNFHVTVPFAGIGGIVLALLNQIKNKKN
ncbi:MAG: hypothetical protein ACTSP9_05055 [Promethearchaeota archaeon]